MNIRDYTEELISLRHHFHQHPELALQEVEISADIWRSWAMRSLLWNLPG